MERNKAPITNTDQVLVALWKASEIARTLQLTRAEHEAMMRADTLDLIVEPSSEERHYLLAFASGAIAAHVQLTIRLSCEFVYQIAAHEGADDVRIFGLTVHGAHPHYSRMTMKERREAVCGYVWRDSEGLVPYTPLVGDRTLDCI